VAYAAAHVVPLPLADNTPGAPADLDWGGVVEVERSSTPTSGPATRTRLSPPWRTAGPPSSPRHWPPRPRSEPA